jgi:GTP-binding protein
VQSQNLRNIAIIAHVDHGKTTLVDELLKQSGAVARAHADEVRIMDSNDLEKERGITILAKNTSIEYKEHKINIVDTPGHADFGGEVERVLSMVDSVLLIVDAVEGPMPQTRFVTEKAFKQGLNPIVVINKIDRPDSRCDWVIDQVFELFDQLGATEQQLDFPVLYASAIQGFATTDENIVSDNMRPLLDAIIELVPAPDVDIDAPFQMQVSSLDYSSYVGMIGIGRVTNGYVNINQQVVVVDRNGVNRTAKIGQLWEHKGLERNSVETVSAGDIVALSGIDPLQISDTICDKNHPAQLPTLTVDEPIISMVFRVNDSPLAGQEGKFVTSRQIRDRLTREQLHNIALKVEDTADPDKFKVSGRGELHLSILIETLRREGFEMAISKPQVIMKEENGKMLEPFERLVVEVDSAYQGQIMKSLGDRRAILKDMLTHGNNTVRMEFVVPARGMIGFHSEFLTLSSGTGIMTHVFECYDEVQELSSFRKNGALISNCAGVSTGYSLWNLQPRGKLFIGPQVKVYEGMIVGIHSRTNDLVVNIIKGKQLTNVRASGTDENITLTPPIILTLEQGMDFLNDDELLEVTPKSLRVRKEFLKEHERKRASRGGAN